MRSNTAERAKRAYEHLGLVRLANGDACEGRWVAISLADGRCDLKLYETKAEAIRFQLHETQCAYLCVNGVPTLPEVEFFLNFNEEMYDAGFHLADPDTYVNPETFL